MRPLKGGTCQRWRALLPQGRGGKIKKWRLSCRGSARYKKKIGVGKEIRGCARVYLRAIGLRKSQGSNSGEVGDGWARVARVERGTGWELEGKGWEGKGTREGKEVEK